MKEIVNVLALIKGEERYIFLYDDTSRAEVLRTLGRFAGNPELSFNWCDAAVLAQKIKQKTSFNLRLNQLLNLLGNSD